MQASLSRTAEQRELQRQHASDMIRERLTSRSNHSYLRHAVLGAIDGCVTTFAVVAAARGGGLSNAIVLILGLANLLADGLSMAVSNYNSAITEAEELDEARARERKHIQLVPDGEREEIRQIFTAKGFQGDALDHIVAVITADEDLWIDTMLTEELGLQPVSESPLRAAIFTFLAFLAVGFVPLVPFLIPGFAPASRFAISLSLAGVAFFAVGWSKGAIIGRHPLRGAFTTFATGIAAALVAYLVGIFVSQFAAA